MTDLTKPIDPADSLIEYPSAFAETITGVVVRHDPTFHIDKLEVRPSSKGNYTGLTANVNAVNREQLDNLYRALSSHPMVKMVL
jgi:putative lipoic acid-binding regulatory protein